jgi:hypothetical protein
MTIWSFRKKYGGVSMATETTDPLSPQALAAEPQRSHIQFIMPLIFWASIILASIDLFSAESLGCVVRFASSCSYRVRNCCGF